MVKRFIQTWNKTNLMKRFAIGIFVGALLALLLPQASAIGLLGGNLCRRFAGYCSSFSLRPRR